jgi:hypothetical protein
MADKGLLEAGQHMGVSGESDKVHGMINARFEGVVFSRLGLAETTIRRGDGDNLGGASGKARHVVYAAHIDRRTTAQTVAIAMCAEIQGRKLTTPATTLDRLPWKQLHVRTYSDTELGDLCDQLDALDWSLLGAPQQLAIDSYDALPDVMIYRDRVDQSDRRARDSNVCTYRTKDGTLVMAVRPHRDGTAGNDMPKESSFVPVFEIFDCVVWFA